MFIDDENTSNIEQTINMKKTLDEQARITREKYSDIIDLERPVLKKRNISIEDRAAQFAPFAALTGYHESVEDTEQKHSSDNELGGITHDDFFE